MDCVGILSPRFDVPDCNKKFPSSLTLQTNSKDYTEREMKNGGLNQQSSQWPNQDMLEETNVHIAADNSACSYNGDNLAVSEKIQSINLSSHFPPAKSDRSRPALAFFLQQNISKPSYTESVPPAEHKMHLYSGNADDMPIYQNLPPPLPPKKYALTSFHGLEHESTVDLIPAEMLHTNPSGVERHAVSITSKAASEAGPFTNEERIQATFQGREPSRASIPSSLSANDLWTVSSNPTNKGVSHKGLSASSLDANANDIISLTTYFSVDNCMTDTYRMKYHQRPKLYFADTGVLNKETSLPPTGMPLNSSYHNTSDTEHSTAEQRHKPSIENVHCSR